jgi:hypothetical protein
MWVYQNTALDIFLFNGICVLPGIQHDKAARRGDVFNAQPG